MKAPLEAAVSARAAPATEIADRVLCEHADRCGGCPVIGLSYPDQLALKRGRVVQSVARYASLELVYTEPTAPAEPFEAYRTRAKLVVGPGAQMGLYAKGGGHQVVDIPDCRVLAPVLGRAASALRALVARDEAESGPLAPFDATRRGALRAVDLREVVGGEAPQVLATFVMQRDRAAPLESLERAARELITLCPAVGGVAVNYHEGESPQVLGAETVFLAGASALPDRVGETRHLATFGSFVQAHRGQAARVHQLLRQVALGAAQDRPPRALDLYGGSGAIALGLAAAGAAVRMIESFAPAVAQAKAAAAAAGLSLEADAMDVATALRGLVERREPFDAIVVNPPRRGTSPTAREWMARLEAPVIAYVSCDPETLARDLDHLSRLGYATTSIRPLDMIPLTDEVETVAVLRRSGTPSPRVVYEDREVVVVDKSAHEPTVPQGEYAGSLLARVRKIPGAERAVPVQRLEVGTSGLVVFARSSEVAPRWEAVMASSAARLVFVAGARGITPSKGAITRDLRESGRSLPARTRYRRLALSAGHSVLRVVPENAYPHQVRRHLAAIGHPVLGDDRYGHATTNRYFEERCGLDRTFLHCVRLEVDHPGTGARLLVESALPGDLRAVLDRTGGPATLRFLDHKNALGASGTSHLPPGADEVTHDRGSALDVESTTLTLKPELTGGDDDSSAGDP